MAIFSFEAIKEGMDAVFLAFYKAELVSKYWQIA